MNPQEEQFENDFKSVDFEKLSADLKSFSAPPGPVPPEVDRRILDMANRRIVRRRPVLRWIGWAGSAAAAALIILVLTMNLPEKSGQMPSTTRSRRFSAYDSPMPEALATKTAAADIDRNGKVNILDAFKLARSLQSSQAGQSQWDVNGDGQVNHGDVDTIAIVAVSLDKGARL